MQSCSFFGQLGFDPSVCCDVLRGHPHLCELSVRQIFDFHLFVVRLVLLRQEDEGLSVLRLPRRIAGALLLRCHAVCWNEPRWAPKLLLEVTLRNEKAPQ
jgi:hypothetical protein